MHHGRGLQHWLYSSVKYSVLTSQHNLRNQIKTRQEGQFGQGYTHSRSDHSLPHMVKSFSPRLLWEEEARGNIQRSRPSPQTSSRHIWAIWREQSWEISAPRAEKQLLSHATLQDLCLTALSANHKLYSATRNTEVCTLRGKKKRWGQEKREEKKNTTQWKSWSAK